MPDIYLHGHFAVVSSKLAPAKWKTGTGKPGNSKRQMALLEVHPHLLKYKKDDQGFEYVSLRIDQRLTCIKQVIHHSGNFFIFNKKGWWHHNREWQRLTDMADDFEKLWPLHILSKRWPLPLPEYSV